MPRPVWKGVVSFGLVAIPVRLYLATESRSIHFRLLCPEHKTPIKNRRWCPTGDHDVAWNDVVRGYEESKGRYVILADEDLDKLPLATRRTIDINAFVASDAIPGELYYQTAYYVEPDANAAKPYALLRRTLEDTDRIALAKIALREREHLAAVRPRDGVLVLNTLFWPDEIRSVEGLDIPEKEPLHARELTMAKTLVEAMTAEFKPEEYTDEYREALEEVIKAKEKGADIVVEPEAPEATVVDIMDALKASVQAAKEREKVQRRKQRTRRKAS